MMRSLFSGVSGLRVHQLRMDVIGNNIANVNTVGYKASRMTFADAISQRMSIATADNPDVGRAGRNPMQVGLGVNIGGISSLMTQGAAQRTERPLDLAIEGEGFFVLEDESGRFFTRAGNIDWNGNIFSIGGIPLMGWGAVEDSQRPGSFVIEEGPVQTLTTPREVHYMDPAATTLINAMGNLNVEDLVDGSIIRHMEFFDSLGNRYTADMRFTWHPPANHPDAPEPGPGVIYSTNERSLWSFGFLPGNVVGGYSQVTFFLNGDRERGTTVNMRMGITEDNVIEGNPGSPGTSGVIGFSPTNGRVNLFQVGVGGDGADLYRSELGLFINVPALTPPSTVGEDAEVDDPPTFNSGVIRLNMDNLRQQANMPSNVRTEFVDGNPPGTLQDISIGRDGIIMGRYSNGEMRPLGQIPLAQFLNPAGLERVGNNLWVISANSGDFDGIGSHGDFIAGSLEMSNVELSEEFTGMITTQRGFQANSRVISTSDEILQELVNLKR